MHDDDDDDMKYIGLYVTCKYLYLYYLVDFFLLEFLFYSMIWPYAKKLNPSNLKGSVVEFWNFHGGPQESTFLRNPVKRFSRDHSHGHNLTSHPKDKDLSISYILANDYW